MGNMRLKDVRNYPGVDITDYSFKKVNELINEEHGLEEIGTSCGIYGVNGRLVKGYATGTVYKVTKRTIALFMIG